MSYRLYAIGICIAIISSCIWCIFTITIYKLTIVTLNYGGNSVSFISVALMILMMFLFIFIWQKIMNNIKRTEHNYALIKQKAGSFYWLLHVLIAVPSYFLFFYIFSGMNVSEVPHLVKWLGMGLGFGTSIVLVIDFFYVAFRMQDSDEDRWVKKH